MSDTEDRRLIGGIAHKRSPSGYWVPDYSVPGVREAVNRSVDEAYETHWSIDKTRG